MLRLLLVPVLVLLLLVLVPLLRLLLLLLVLLSLTPSLVLPRPVLRRQGAPRARATQEAPVPRRDRRDEHREQPGRVPRPDEALDLRHPGRRHQGAQRLAVGLRRRVLLALLDPRDALELLERQFASEGRPESLPHSLRVELSCVPSTAVAAGFSAVPVWPLDAPAAPPSPAPPRAGPPPDGGGRGASLFPCSRCSSIMLPLRAAYAACSFFPLQLCLGRLPRLYQRLPHIIVVPLAQEKCCCFRLHLLLLFRRFLPPNQDPAVYSKVLVNLVRF